MAATGAGAPPPPGRADGATVAAIFAAVLLIVPARLVLKALPLSLTPANVVSLGAALLWLCAQFTLTLGAAKGATRCVRRCSRTSPRWWPPTGSPPGVTWTPTS
ncbi:hypothetical protein ACFQQB_27245 [Nonomuraea rubra]|uniref:hypothetical protein n=1 Tax=Nonomuraea rubra TaxID=46180 RepID=UPI0036109B7A